MPKRSRKEDSSEAARRVVDTIIDKTEKHEKNPAAVALGRLGGLKGGVARARKLSAKERTRIARKAAAARWRGSK